jgi:hypothetical protein
MIARCRVPAAVLCLLFVAAAAIAVAEPVDRMAAAVNDDVITESDVAHAVALSRLSKTAADAAPLYQDTLAGLINGRLLAQEARRTRFVDISEAEVNASLEELKKRFESEAAFSSFLREQDMTPREIRSMLADQLLVERFVEKKVALFVRVSRADAEQYFREHQDRFKGKRFPEAQKLIMAELTDRKIGEQIDRAVAELRSKAVIRTTSR